MLRDNASTSYELMSSRSYPLLIALFLSQNFAGSVSVVTIHATARIMQHAMSTMVAVLLAVMMATWWTLMISGTLVPGMDMGVK